MARFSDGLLGHGLLMCFCGCTVCMCILWALLSVSLTWVRIFVFGICPVISHGCGPHFAAVALDFLCGRVCCGSICGRGPGVCYVWYID